MLRKLLTRFRSKESNLEHFDPPTDADFEYFKSLCSVWPGGYHTRLYMETNDPKYIGPASDEIRQSVMSSYTIDTPLGIDHIEILNKISYASKR